MRYLYFVAAATMFAGCAGPTQIEQDYMRDTSARLAVCRNDADKLDRILDQVTLPAPQRHSLLTAALNHGHDDCIGIMLDHGFDPEVAATQTETPLAIACRRNDCRAAEMLLKAGAAPKPELTPICSPEMLALLLEYGFNPNTRTQHGYSPLELAINGTSYPKAKMLLEAGARPDVFQQDPFPFTHIKNTSMILLLLRHGATLPEHDSGLLAKAVSDGDLELFDFLLEKGYTVDEGNLVSLIGMAVSSRNILVLERVLNAGEPGLVRRVLCDSNQLEMYPRMQRIADAKDAYIMALLLEHGARCEPKTAVELIGMVMNTGDMKAAGRFCRAAAARFGETYVLEAADERCHPRGTVTLKLLKAGFKPSKDSPLLMRAIERGDHELAEMLLAAGADTYMVDNFGNTPLILACNREDSDMIELLLAAGADASYSGNAKTPPPLCAALYAHERENLNSCPGQVKPKEFPDPRMNIRKIITLLMDAGAKLPHERQYGLRIVNTAIVEEDTELIELFLATGLDINATSCFDETPLVLSMHKRQTRMFQYLLRHGARPDVRTRDGMSLLQWLASRGDLFEIKLLLQYGADPNFPSSDGSTPIMRAEHPATMKTLLDAGANVNARNRRGQTALMTLENRNAEMSALLLRAGIDVNAQDMDGTTALMIAARENNGITTKLLLEFGADPKLTDKAGETALDRAFSWETHFLLAHAMGIKPPEPAPVARPAEECSPQPAAVK